METGFPPRRKVSRSQRSTVITEKLTSRKKPLESDTRHLVSVHTLE